MRSWGGPEPTRNIQIKGNSLTSAPVAPGHCFLLCATRVRQVRRAVGMRSRRDGHPSQLSAELAPTSAATMSPSERGSANLLPYVGTPLKTVTPREKKWIFCRTKIRRLIGYTWQSQAG